MKKSWLGKDTLTRLAMCLSYTSCIFYTPLFIIKEKTWNCNFSDCILTSVLYFSNSKNQKKKKTLFDIKSASWTALFVFQLLQWTKQEKSITSVYIDYKEEKNRINITFKKVSPCWLSFQTYLPALSRNSARPMPRTSESVLFTDAPWTHPFGSPHWLPQTMLLASMVIKSLQSSPCCPTGLCH